MGLDSVELLMEIEHRIQISVPDEDAQEILTVGKLCDYLLARANLFLACPCPTAVAFYHLRRVLVDELGIARSYVKPQIDTDSLFPEEDRIRNWKRLREQLGTALPNLEVPKGIRISFRCIRGALAISIVTVKILALLGVLNFLIALVWAGIAILILIFTHLVARRFKVGIPNDAATIGALSRILVKRLYLPTERNRAELESWVWNQVCEAIVGILNVDRELITRKSRFVEDLGVG